MVYHDLRLCQLFDMERDLVNRIEPFLEIIR